MSPSHIFYHSTVNPQTKSIYISKDLDVTEREHLDQQKQFTVSPKAQLIHGKRFYNSVAI